MILLSWFNALPIGTKVFWICIFGIFCIIAFYYFAKFILRIDLITELKKENSE